MTDWGRKFKAGLAIMLFTMLLFLVGKLSESAFMTMELTFFTGLFVTSVAGKFAKDK